MVNGKLTENININRSVRQGCPLSMLLYILCLEPLIQRINKMIKSKVLNYPIVNRKLNRFNMQTI